MAFSIGHLLTAVGRGGAGYLAGREERDRYQEEQDRLAKQELYNQMMGRAKFALERGESRRAAGQQQVENLQRERQLGIQEAELDQRPRGVVVERLVDQKPMRQVKDVTDASWIGEPWEVEGGRSGLSEAQKLQETNRQFNRENALVDDYQRVVTPWLIPYNALTRAMAYVDKAKTGDTAAQLQLLYAFINTLDNSVVREGEAAMFARAAPALDRGRMMIDRVARGAAMTREQVEQITDILGDVKMAFTNRFDVFKRSYSDRAKRWNVDPESFISIPETVGTIERAPTVGHPKKPEDF